MTNICYWDAEEGAQKERPMTAGELAQRALDIAAATAPSRAKLKEARQAAVDAITVTVDGMVFDGDETSQERMARALRVADDTGQTSCTWVLHDNTPAVVTRAQLAQALALAMQAQGAIWVIPS